MKNQLILDFPVSEVYLREDFFVTKSNKDIFNYLESWPKWEKNLINIFGPSGSGKSHLVSIFKKKVSSLIINSNNISDEVFIKLKSKQALIIEDLAENVSEQLLYSIFNTIVQENKYLIITSKKSLRLFKFNLLDLKSRIQFVLNFEIKLPDDNLIFVILAKNFSDRQIKVNKKIIDYIIRRIDRSYENISNFVSLLDKNSLKKGKPFNYKIIDETLNCLRHLNKNE